MSFSKENDGGIVKKLSFMPKNNPSAASRQLPLHKGAFCFVQIDSLLFEGEVCQWAGLSPWEGSQRARLLLGSPYGRAPAVAGERAFVMRFSFITDDQPRKRGRP